MNDRLIHLRIKIKSLAAEAVIIRQEARKVSGMSKWVLNDHRTRIVRDHSRHNLLAYGLLRRKSYAEMEKKCEIAPDFKRILEIAKRFGEEDELYSMQWIEDAKAHLKAQLSVR